MAKYIKVDGKFIKENSITTSIVKDLNLTGEDFENYSISSRKLRIDTEVQFNNQQLLNVGEIGINTSFIHSSAIFEINSTNKGILIPRLTDNQKQDINNPANGLMIYNYNSKTIEIYNGNKWVKLLGDTIYIDFDLNGNSIINVSNIYLTGNNLSNETNIFMGKENAYIKNLGPNTKLNIQFPEINIETNKIGLNNSNPIYEFDVNGTISTDYLNLKKSNEPLVNENNAIIYYGNDGFIHIKLENKDFPILNLKFIQEIPEGEIDGINKVYYLSHVPIRNTLKLYINGIKYNNYVLNDNVIEMDEPIWQGAELEVEYIYIE